MEKIDRQLEELRERRARHNYGDGDLDDNILYLYTYIKLKRD